MIVFVDKKMKCNDCKTDFIFLKGEQEFFLERGYAPPTRCPECRKSRKKDRRKKRRSLLRAISAAESVTVVVAAGPSVADVSKQESASMGIVPAEATVQPAQPMVPPVVESAKPKIKKGKKI